MQTSEELITRARKASVAIYIAVDEPVADDVSEILTQLADRLEKAIAEIHYATHGDNDDAVDS